MKRLLGGMMISAASLGASAGTYEISLKDISWSVVDLTPGDEFVPSYTVETGSLLTLLNPVDIHEKWGAFESGTVLPPTIGGSTDLTGLLYPGTQLIWKATGQLRLSVIDVDQMWDYDSIEVRTTFSSTDVGSGYSYLELRTFLSGTGDATYTRLTRDLSFDVELRATNYQALYPIQYQLGWFNQYQTESFDGTAPVPEPSTYALMVVGLGFVGSAVARRKGANA